jgi:uncharacterized protein YndB with AHSA1/START domain
MTEDIGNLEVRVERTIHAPCDAVFDAWLNPRVPGNPWNMAEKLLLDPKVDGLFYWSTKTTPHYGRFTNVERPHRIEHTWVSPNTLGNESTVLVTFKKQGDHTLMTLLHTGLPDNEGGRGHERGWTYFMDLFPGRFAGERSQPA